jgi:hypothetical protein
MGREWCVSSIMTFMSARANYINHGICPSNNTPLSLCPPLIYFFMDNISYPLTFIFLFLFDHLVNTSVFFFFQISKQNRASHSHTIFWQYTLTYYSIGHVSTCLSTYTNCLSYVIKLMKMIKLILFKCKRPN